MPVIKALPSPEVIRGFRGVLDFYVWKGLNCVRKWPVIPKASRTPKSIAAAVLFGAVVQGYALLGGALKTLFIEDAADQDRTGRDLYVSAVYGHLHETIMTDFLDLLTEATAYLKTLADLANALESVGTDELRAHPGFDGADYQPLRVDGNLHLQADVLSSALPALAATAAHQVTQNTALALIEKLEKALSSVATDQLRVDVTSLPDPFDIATLRSASYIRYASYLYGLLSNKTMRKWLSGEKLTAITDNTFFNILEFNQNTAAITSYHGLCSGILTITVRGRHTSGYIEQKVARYHIAVKNAAVGYTLTLYQTELSSFDVSHEPITITLQSADATNTHLKLQAKFTHTNWDINYPSATWHFDCHYHSNSTTRIPFPSIA